MNKKKKFIYVAYTGGTIGMQSSSRGYVPVAGYLQQQLKLMPEFNHPEMPDFIVCEYTHLIDSSDVTPHDWQNIADDIKQNYHRYDGFVILHGTDTMAFTASALSFMLENLVKPVIVTGSQIPLAQIRSDGYTNLLNALYIAAYYPVHEVSLFFNNKLFRGNRTTKVNTDSFDAFASPHLPPLLEVGTHIHSINSATGLICHGELNVHSIIPQPISIVTLYPGISRAILRNFLLRPVRALILRSYGVGNSPQEVEIIDELRNACKRGIVIINITQCIYGRINMEGYATGNTLARAGVISGFDMTIEATLTKLYYLFSQRLTLEQIRCQMQQDLRGELSISD